MTESGPTGPTGAEARRAAREAADVAGIRAMGRRMLRGGSWPALAVGVVATAIAWLLAGPAGLLGAAAAVVITLLVCASVPVIMVLTASYGSWSVLAAALGGFALKFSVFLVLLTQADRLTAIDDRAFAFTLGGVALAFIAGEVIAAARAQVPVVSV